MKPKVINITERLPKKLQRNLFHRVFVYYGTVAKPLQLLAIKKRYSTIASFSRIKNISHARVNGNSVKDSYKLKHEDIVTAIGNVTGG